MIKLHASSIGKIMTAAKSKKPEDLSVGAITYCYELAKEFVYQYKTEIDSKYLTKGNMCENDSIELYNNVFFSSNKKYVGRIENALFTGECDILAPHKIIDIKTAWSKATFPALPGRIDSKLYEWQGRCYMHLYDRPLFEIAYCLVSTPSELISYEDDSLHFVDDIEPEYRVTIKQFSRDLELEQLMVTKATAAQIKIEEFINEIRNR